MRTLPLTSFLFVYALRNFNNCTQKKNLQNYYVKQNTAVAQRDDSFLLLFSPKRHRLAQFANMAEHPVLETTSRTIKKLKIETARETFLSPFFGENTVPKFRYIHPCATVSKRVHQCLDDHNNEGRFCQSVATLLEQCLREYNL